MDFQIERRNVDEGWQPIIEALHRDLLELDPDYRIAQIKEKFGGLRYYIYISEGVDDAAQQDMYRLINVAEELSLQTCEKCGAPGKSISAHFWIKTACETHA